jgi:hypothetical protein
MLDRPAALQPDLLAREALGDRQEVQGSGEPAVERTHALARLCTSSEPIHPIVNWSVHRAGEPFVSFGRNKRLARFSFVSKSCAKGALRWKRLIWRFAYGFQCRAK